MYYATFNGIGISDIAVFETEQDRDNWVNFKDDFSSVFGVTKENATFKRKILTNKKEIENVTSNKNIKRVEDTYNSKQWWYLRSII